MIFRDTFHAGLELTRDLLKQLGVEEVEAETICETFATHDHELLKRQHAIRHDEKILIQSAREAAAELETLLQADRKRSGES